MSPAELEKLAAACRERAASAIVPLGRPDIEEDLREFPIAFKADRRVTSKWGHCREEGLRHLGEVVVYTHDQPARCFEETVMHELAHAVVHYMRPEERVWHANGLFGHVMGLFGFARPASHWKDVDRSCGFREVKKKGAVRRR